MEKRVLLAVVLSFVVLYGYQALFPPPKPQPKAGAATGAPAGAPASRRPQASERAGGATRSGCPSRRRASCGGARRGQPKSATSGSRTSRSRAVFTTRGGALKSWRLKKYQDAAREPLELVRTTVPAGTLRPFTLSVAGRAPSARRSRRRSSSRARPSVHAGVGAGDAHVRVSGRQRAHRAQGILVRPRRRPTSSISPRP